MILCIGHNDMGIAFEGIVALGKLGMAVPVDVFPCAWRDEGQRIGADANDVAKFFMELADLEFNVSLKARDLRSQRKCNLELGAAKFAERMEIQVVKGGPYYRCNIDPDDNDDGEKKGA